MLNFDCPRRSTRFYLLAFLCVSVCFTSANLPAQTTLSTGSINGTVTDSTGAVVSGANITITNNGPSAATNVTLADTYNATNLSLVSYTPSAGTTCTNTATTINCTLPTSFASGATATVTVVVSTTAPGFYPNTATITDSGTPPDPNTGNNTYVALAPVVSVVCSTARRPSRPACTVDLACLMAFRF